MALARGRRTSPPDYWPGFVDAMASLLLVIIFLLSVFILAQFFLSQEISGKDTVLNRLNAQIVELTELLALEKAGKQGLESQIANLTANLTSNEKTREQLQNSLNQERTRTASSSKTTSGLQGDLDKEKRLSAQALSQVKLLNQQIAAIRRQIQALEDALEASESRDKQSQTKIADLGRRLNVALAQRVQELSRYRSDFFGRLRQILSQRADIRIEGDRFVFQSEVLFPSASDVINPGGAAELSKLAKAIIELNSQIPKEINWVIRVDGHTDMRPLSGQGRLRNNWELSAARAISVVRYLIEQGVPPKRLIAAGFGEFQPIEKGESEEVYAKNRRIEFKLTER